MKKLFITAALLAGLSANAQLAKGRMMLGGNFNYTNNKNSSYDSTSSAPNREVKNTFFNVTARYGYFFTDHLMGGIYGGFSNSTLHLTAPTSFPSTLQDKINTFSGGLFGRYYQMIGNSRFALFGQLSLGYGHGKGEYRSGQNSSALDYTNGSKLSSITAFVNPGLVYFVTNHIAVEASFGNVGYTAQKTDTYDRNHKLINEQKNAGFNSGLSFSLASLFLGVNFYFGGKNTASTPVRNPGT